MLRNRRKTLFFAQRHPDSGICLLSFCVIMRNYSLPQENHLFAGTWKHVGGKSCKSAARPPLKITLEFHPHHAPGSQLTARRSRFALARANLCGRLAPREFSGRSGLVRAARYFAHPASRGAQNLGGGGVARGIGDVRKSLRRARAQTRHVRGPWQQSLAEHLAVSAALKARDCDAA